MVKENTNYGKSYITPEFSITSSNYSFNVIMTSLDLAEKDWMKMGGGE